MAKVIVHIDLNAFFASAEVARNPSLAGKPLIIGHAGRGGIVSTCSYEARKYGVHSAQPTFQALKLCPQAIIIAPDMDYYAALSRSFFAKVREITPLVEEASIDECYADFTKALSKEKDPVAFLANLQREWKEFTGVGCSIGVATNKWLAKMASDLHKPMGLTIIHKDDIPKVIYPLPIESFWGIGKKTSPLLRNLGISTIGDFARRAKEDDPALIKTLGKFFLTAKEWSLGSGSDEIKTAPWDPKSVGVSETLMRDCRGYSEIESTLRSICLEVERRAKWERKYGKGMTLQVKDTSFKTHNKSATFEKSTQSGEFLFKKASELYKANFEDLDVRLIGVTLEKLVDPGKEDVQMSLWDYEEYEEKDKTRLLIADLNRKLGKGTLIRGSEARKGKKK